MTRSSNPDLALQLERERSERKEEIAALKSEMLAKVECISSLASKTFTPEAIAVQTETVRGLMALNKGLEVVELGLAKETQTRKAEIATLTRTFGETKNDAAEKIGDGSTVLHRGIDSTPKATEISDCAPQRTEIFLDYYVKVGQVQDQLAEEIASLTARIDSAPWTKSIEQASQSMKDAAEDCSRLVRMTEASQTGISNLRQEMQKELADLRMASQGRTDRPRLPSVLPSQGRSEELTDGEPQKNDVAKDFFIKLQQARDQLSELNAPISHTEEMEAVKEA
jgi:hypothetical protein